MRSKLQNPTASLPQTSSTSVAPLSFLDYCMPPVHGGDLQRKPKLTNYKQSSLYHARWGMWDDQAYTINYMFRSADDELFQKVLSNHAHVLFLRQPRKKELTYNLRPRAHQCILPILSTAASKNFVQGMLFKDALLIDIVPITYCAMNVMYVLIFLYMLFLLL